jgi:hypothetical protein
MTFAFELTAPFLLAEAVPLDAEDLAYGFERGYIEAQDVVILATCGVNAGSSDPVLLELVALLADQTSRVPEVLTMLDDPERIHDPRESARKWLYLALKAAYVCRAELSDPLGVVEQIYSDFDYPSIVAPFVRYMPLSPGTAAGEKALLKRWQSYLEAESRSLAC